MAPRKAIVMSGLHQIKLSTSTAVGSKFLPEIIRIFHVFDTLEDGDVQVRIIFDQILTNRRRLARFSSTFPLEHENKEEQSFRREESP